MSHHHRKKQAWTSVLRHDPLPSLLALDNKAVALFSARDLLENADANPHDLWDLPAAQSIVRKQQADGSWKYAGGNTAIRSSENYSQIETYRNLGYLVEMFGFDTTNPVITKAIEYLLGFQTRDVDIRGILGNQYTPYYTAGMIELMVKAGLTDDHRIEKAFAWLKSIRQDDGGWAIPLRTHNKKLDVIAMDTKTIEPNRSRPFSHLVTGVVLRAYAAHPTHRHSAEAHVAGELLLSRFFKKDAYPDRSDSDYWVRFTYPFWFTDLISAMDSLSLLGFTKDEPAIEKATQWFIDRQQANGLWNLKALKNEKKYQTALWLDLAICRALKRLYS